MKNGFKLGGMFEVSPIRGIYCIFSEQLDSYGCIFNFVIYAKKFFLVKTCLFIVIFVHFSSNLQRHFLKASRN